jgi:surface-anchored protein
MYRIFSIWAIVLSTASMLSIDCKGDILEFSSGHGDIAVEVEGGAVHMHYHFDQDSVVGGQPVTDPDGLVKDPDEAYIRLGDPAARTITGLSGLGFAENSTAWAITINSEDGVPFLSLDAEEIVAPFQLPSLRLTSMTYSGIAANPVFAAFLDPASPFFATNNGVNALDVFNFGSGHDHINWFFSHEGVYDLTFEAIVPIQGGGEITGSDTFKFVVGSATAVPEPTSMALLVSSCVAGAWFSRRRRKTEVATAS